MIDASRWDVVVLPFVPVIPTSVIARLGWPWTAAATGPMASRTSSTTSWATAGPARGRRAAPPRRPPRLRRRSSWPSWCAPRTQAYSVPGATRRESWVIAVTVTDGSPTSAPSAHGRQLAGEVRRHSRRPRSLGAARRARWRLDAQLVDHRRRQLPEHRRGGRAAEAIIRSRPAAGRSTPGSSPAGPRPAGTRRSWRSRPSCRPALVAAVGLGDEAGAGLAGDRQPGHLGLLGRAPAHDLAHHPLHLLGDLGPDDLVGLRRRASHGPRRRRRPSP